ncbi:hypothetical protein IE81DRAFT_320486 [Ceraceosorus guamensis]|uniref:Secreted protein n=1 Tax=Ceraceosorus guamensis TaxID=1522189 RepID=A0A316W5R3_9BASI|nr:hypothetical protein IE81DRAFT_320486 [Ceraceosorus guamensis]PWN45300.1 hypothetical protein IE81DRAFT_320486 [Ceraceosorus guamensis]
MFPTSLYTGILTLIVAGKAANACSPPWPEPRCFSEPSRSATNPEDPHQMLRLAAAASLRIKRFSNVYVTIHHYEGEQGHESSSTPWLADS